MSLEKAGNDVAAQPPRQQETDHRAERGSGDGVESAQQRTEKLPRNDIKGKSRDWKNDGGRHQENERRRRERTSSLETVRNARFLEGRAQLETPFQDNSNQDQGHDGQALEYKLGGATHRDASFGRNGPNCLPLFIC